MEFYIGFDFFIPLLLAILLITGFRLLGMSIRMPLLILSGWMIVRAHGFSWAITYFIGTIVWQLLIIDRVQRWKKEEKMTTGRRAFAITLSILPLFVSKISSPVFGISIGFIGISYIIFRCLQIIIEISDGLIDEVDPLSTLNFLLFFPTFSAGPIDRSRRFEGDLRASRSREEIAKLFAEGLKKFIIGYGYKFVISMMFFQRMSYYVSGNEWQIIVKYGFYYGFYLFFDFAGYSLMAIGTGYMLGFQIPENFNQPFRATNIKDFWNRWHMSLSFWFRDYLFTPLVLMIRKRKWIKDKQFTAMTAYLVNMTVMGIWHGLSSYYILYGVYHGVLLSAYEWIEKKSAFHKKHKNNTLYRGLSWVVTMVSVFIGFTIFSGRLHQQ